LSTSARETVQDDAAVSVVLSEALLHDLDDDAIWDQGAGFQVGAHLVTERIVGGECLPEELACGDMW